MRDIAPAYVGVIKQFGWRHVVMIVQNENLFTKVREYRNSKHVYD